MPFPHFTEKYDSAPFFNPDDFIVYVDKIGQMERRPAPRAVLLSYQKSLFRHVLSKYATRPATGYFGTFLHYVEDTDGDVAIAGNFGIGAPAAAVMLEELIAWGVRDFISLGTAGSLRADISPGDLVLCDGAFRDEGVSYHYFPGPHDSMLHGQAVSALAHPDTMLTARLDMALRDRGFGFATGPTWTTDALYRETPCEVVGFRDRGALVVEMEAAALFAVAKFRGVRIASCFSVSDTLAELQWRPEFHTETTLEGLQNLFAAALEALQSTKT